VQANGGREVTLGIRPEHLSLVPDSDAAIRLKVEYVEVLGADTLVHGHFGTEETLLTARLPDVCHFRKHEIIPVSVPSRKLHLFDRQTGQRINP